MPTVSRKFSPRRISDKVEGPHPLRYVRLVLMHLFDALEAPAQLFGGGTGTPGTGSGPASTLATRFQVDWVANGPYRVDTDVDGAWVVPTPCEIAKLRLWRGDAGTSGSTILDIKANGASLYGFPSTRPTIDYTLGDGAVIDCVLPSAVALAADDVVTVDTVQRESGRPMNWRLTLEAA
jgi:hypothetical protein